MKGSLVYELRNKPKSIAKEKGTGVPLPISSDNFVRLVDYIVYQREGDKEPKSYTICVVKGEPSVFLEDHSDKSASKKKIEYLNIHSGYAIIPATNPNLIEFLKLSSEYGGNKGELLKKVDAGRTASERIQKDKEFTQAKALVYDDNNIKKTKAYAVSNNLITASALEDYEDSVVMSLVVRSINVENAGKFIETFNSELLSRKYEMLEVQKQGKISIDLRSKNVKFADNGAIICPFEGTDAITALARHTLTQAGAQTYQFLTEGINDEEEEIEVTKVTKEELSKLDIEDLVKRGMRVGAIPKKGNSYKFGAVNVGGDNVKVVAHFTKYPEKVDDLIGLIIAKS